MRKRSIRPLRVESGHTGRNHNLQRLERSPSHGSLADHARWRARPGGQIEAAGEPSQPDTAQNQAGHLG